MATIGLIAAMPSEAKALLRLLPTNTKEKVGDYQVFRFDLGAQNCMLVISGMGLVRAGRAAQSLIESFHPSLLISFGIAGAVLSDLWIGDVVLAESSGRLENGCLSPLRPLVNLPELTLQDLSKVLKPFQARVFRGTAVTTSGSQWINPSQDVPNPVLEMETEGIRPLAERAGIPLVVVRSISDGPAAPLPIDLQQAMDADFNLRPWILLRQMLSRPAILFQGGRMMKNSRIATTNAALAVKTILENPLPVTV